jgi:hypothetical protein
VDPFDARPAHESPRQPFFAAGRDRDVVTDELRYEGPIRLEDDPAGGDPPDGGDGGRTLLTAALVGGAVILVLGVALYLRDQPPGVDSLAMLDEAPLAEDPFDDSWGAPAGAVLTGDDGADEIGPESGAVAGSEIAEAPPLRRLPFPEEPAETTTRRSAPDPAPAPRASRAPAPAPAPARPETGAGGSAETVATVSEGIQALVRSGRYGEAATMARERARFAPNGSYTLQVLFACQESTVASAFREGRDGGLMLFPVERPGSSCYRLTWGVFPDRDAALAQAGRVPAHFRRSEAPLAVALERAAGL